MNTESRGGKDFWSWKPSTIRGTIVYQGWYPTAEKAKEAMDGLVRQGPPTNAFVVAANFAIVKPPG